MIRRFYSSSIGCKVVMGITAVVMVGFLCGHLAGNLLVFAGKDALNLYAEKLRDFIAVLWILRVATLASFIVHITAAIRLAALTRKTKPRTYVKKNKVQVSYAAMSMLLSGSTVLAFVFYHLAHLTFRLTHPEFAELGPYDVYSMLIASFRSPLVSGFYVLSISLLLLHLRHGLGSLLQTLGLNHHKYNQLLKGGVNSLVFVLGSGFLSIPISIFFGLIG